MNQKAKLYKCTDLTKQMAAVLRSSCFIYYILKVLEGDCYSARNYRD